MSANPIWIAGYFGPVAGAAPVWIAPGDGTVPSAVQSEIVSYYAPVAGATAVWIAGFFAPPPAAIGAIPITISGWGGSGGGGPPPSTSVWSASDATANGMTLSNGGLTVAFVSAGYQSIRGTNGQASGKVYVEFLNTASDVLETGFGFASASFTPTSYLGASNYSFGSFNAGSGNVSSPSADFTSIVTVASSPAAANDVWAIALDLTAGKFWLARNNVWFGSGAPGSGGNPLATFVAPALGQTYFPAITGNSPSCGVWTLQSTAASQTYAPPSGFSAWDSAAPTHSAEALAYLARTMGGNEGGNGANIATLIDGLVADGVWAKLDALYVLAQQNQTDALLNLMGTSYGLMQQGSLAKPGPRTGSIAFTQYVGFSGFSGGSYLDTGFNATTATSPHFVQDSASVGVWSPTTSVGDAGFQIGNGAGGTPTNQTNISAHYTDGNFYVRVNAFGGSGLASPAVAGLYAGDRASSANVVGYFNGASAGLQTVTSQAPTNADFTVGTASQGFGTSQTLSAAFIGASLGAAGQLALYNRLRTYMTAVGVP